jgi:SAM-dependent methyltransferase
VSNEKSTARSSVRVDLENWFETDLGRSMLASVLLRLGALLPTLFGYHILQLGLFRDKPLMGASRISHQVVFSIDPALHPQAENGVLSEASALPVAADCVDVVLLPYVLEFEREPHDVLREVERVLIGEGHVVIIGFNPWSCWGLWRLLLWWRDNVPWSGRFLRIGRLKDWLKLLGFEVTHSSRVFFRPPVRSARLLRNLGFLEVLGRKLLPLFGGCYIIVARKRLQRLIPIRTQWRARRRLIAAGVVEPTTYRSARDEN